MERDSNDLGMPDAFKLGKSIADGDLETAIAEGATLVRVGRAVFGNRQAAIDTA